MFSEEPELTQPMMGGRGLVPAVYLQAQPLTTELYCPQTPGTVLRTSPLLLPAP